LRTILLVLALFVDNFNLIAQSEVDVIDFGAEASKLWDTRVEDLSVMLGILFVETDTTLHINMGFQIDAVLESYVAAAVHRLKYMKDRLSIKI